MTYRYLGSHYESGSAVIILSVPGTSRVSGPSNHHRQHHQLVLNVTGMELYIVKFHAMRLGSGQSVRVAKSKPHGIGCHWLASQSFNGHVEI